jgi:hypothetical protein
MLARWSKDAAPVPPSEANLNAVAAFEGAVVSGAIFSEPEADSPLPATVAQISALGRRNEDTRAFGRVTLKLRVRESTLASYRWNRCGTPGGVFEGLLVRSGNGAPTCLRFLCESLIDSWRHALGRDVAYGSVYARDRYRCTNPVCARRDVTPPPHRVPIARWRRHGRQRDEPLRGMPPGRCSRRTPRGARARIGH